MLVSHYIATSFRLVEFQDMSTGTYAISATGQWFSPGPLVSSINKTDHHDITEILLKVALNTIKQTNILSIDNQSKLR
jgi:hypothetical protein